MLILIYDKAMWVLEKLRRLLNSDPQKETKLKVKLLHFVLSEYSCFDITIVQVMWSFELYILSQMVFIFHPLFAPDPHDFLPWLRALKNSAISNILHFFPNLWKYYLSVAIYFIRLYTIKVLATFGLGDKSSFLKPLLKNISPSERDETNIRREKNKIKNKFFLGEIYLCSCSVVLILILIFTFEEKCFCWEIFLFYLLLKSKNIIILFYKNSSQTSTKLFGYF